MEDRMHREMIRRSHERCLQFGLEEKGGSSRGTLSGNELKRLLRKKEELIDITNPIIEELYAFLKGTGFIIILTDEEGYIIAMTGDEDPLEIAREQNLVLGTSMNEKSIGTNAMGTAIAEDIPVQITAAEHVTPIFHLWTCSAAPIHDTNGSITGTINLTGNSDLVHPHTLGLAVAAASAIEYQINNLNIQKQLHNSNQFAFAMMNNLSYGLFAMDLEDNILWVNDTACRSINIRRLNLVNRPIESIFPDWSKAKQAILRNGQYSDEEGRFNIPDLKEKYFFTAYPIKTREGEMIGTLLSFREYSGLMKFINRVAGYSTRYTFKDLIGESNLTKDLIRYCKTIAKNPSTILITGETGTGKEIIAQSIHHASPRRDNAFVAVNCGAISESLMESELFGYVEGAFTGALKGGRPGKFELADKGTLFLDEIGEMPLDMQVKVLRAIQEKAVIRVGSDKPIPVDVRIITATNKDLEEEVKAGRFRLDLYYRLNVLEVKVPSLRERREDIRPLILHFLKKKAAKFDIPIPELRSGLMEELIRYDWPGNVRELENLMERAVILNGNLTTEHLRQPMHSVHSPVPSSSLESFNADQSWNLAEIEKNTILKALAHFGNNISKCAGALGLSRNTLYQKMKKYGLHQGN